VIKLVNSLDFNFDDMTARPLQLWSGGIDFGNFTKTAPSSRIRDMISKLAFDKDHTYVHVLAVGDTETTGPNRNADGFSGQWNKTAKDHFLSGHLFKHHKNSDPALGVGKVALAEYNDDMGRIELVVGMDNKKCAEEVQKVNKGEDIAVSMGAKVAYDVCSICDKHSKSPAEYCDHMKKTAGRVLEDGRQVYVDNPDPRYFDISIVHKPADRCAFSFRKIAGSGYFFVSSVELAKQAGLADKDFAASYDIKILSALRKLAAMEKELEGLISGEKSQQLAALIPQSNSKTCKATSDLCSAKDSVKDVVAALAEDKCILGLPEFITLIGGKQAADLSSDVAKIAAYLPGIYGRMLDSRSNLGLVDEMTTGNARYVSDKAKVAIASLKSEVGMDLSDVRKRVTIGLISPQPVFNIKQSSEKSGSTSLESIAELYAGYKLATILKQREDSPLLHKSVVATNYLSI
jgi:hypothetical protein